MVVLQLACISVCAVLAFARNATKETGRQLGPWPDKTEAVVECGFVDAVSCGEHGTCDDVVTGICTCDSTHFTETLAKPCGTEKKSRVTAILLHVFLGYVGAGAFWLGWTSWGVLPLLMCCLPICCTCIGGIGIGCGVLKASENWKEFAALGTPCLSCFSTLLSTLLLCTGQVFWILVIVWIADSSAADGDGVPLV
mmetsp:Transcript_47081/g.125101  ORF Transcript_47081/g.125101 Transcript_47081/m.125101 type:complete len:196 (-) Transcript_47081:137-724(-)